MLMEPPGDAPCCDDGSARGVAGWLSLAASPAFGTMAVHTAFFGGPAMICSAMPGSSPGGMTVMYALMCLFHAAPWARLLARRPGTATAD